MPNCDFYALQDDHKQVLEFVFSATECKVYEKDSEPGAEIRVFSNSSEVIEAYAASTHSMLLLNLYASCMGGDFKFRRIELDETRFGSGVYRYEAHGWGAIQLYLGRVKGNRLENSHTNHNSRQRAEAWATTIRDLGSPGTWNWEEVVRISDRINRFIRTRSIVSRGSRPVLTHAYEWAQRGGQLG
jgi:hypothetical protein